MGLFTRTRSVRSAAARPAEGKAERAERSAAARGIAGVVMSGLVLAALGIGTLIAVPRLERGVGARTAAEAWRIAIDWPPSSTPGETWVPRPIQGDLLALARAEIERWPDPFSAHALRSAGEALWRTGWFERVEAVQRERGGTIRVAATWRTPAAVVRRDGVDYLISTEAAILPMTFRMGEARCPVILGARLDPPKASGIVVNGDVWPGRDIQAGLALLRTIQGRPWAGQIVGVDVGEYLASRRLVLVTQWNSRILWGGAPGDGVPGEVPTAVKLSRLDTLLKTYGQVDARHRLVELAGPVLLVDDTATANAQ